MANLIEYIQSQVYENSTEDISGSIMQQVLTRMASDEGVVNVHTISGQTPFADYNNAQAARGAVPDGFKKLGLIITYKLSSGWYIDEFIGSATSGWSTASNWKCLGPISVSQNASTGKTTITIGSESFDVATQPVSVSQNTLSIGRENKGELAGQLVDIPEWVRVVVDSENKILYGVKTDGKFYFGDDCPPQIQKYVQEQIDAIGIDNLLAEKVDIVEGKSLIDAEYASSQKVINNPEWLQVVTDSEGRVLEGIDVSGNKIIPGKKNDTVANTDTFLNTNSDNFNIHDECIFHDAFIRNVPDVSKPWQIGSNSSSEGLNIYDYVSIYDADIDDGFRIAETAEYQQYSSAQRLVNYRQATKAKGFRLVKNLTHKDNIIVSLANPKDTGVYQAIAINVKDENNYELMRFYRSIASFMPGALIFERIFCNNGVITSQLLTVKSGSYGNVIAFYFVGNNVRILLDDSNIYQGKLFSPIDNIGMYIDTDRNYLYHFFNIEHISNVITCIDTQPAINKSIFNYTPHYGQIETIDRDNEYAYKQVDNVVDYGVCERFELRYAQGLDVQSDRQENGLSPTYMPIYSKYHCSFDMMFPADFVGDDLVETVFQQHVSLTQGGHSPCVAFRVKKSEKDISKWAIYLVTQSVIQQSYEDAYTYQREWEMCFVEPGAWHHYDIFIKSGYLPEHNPLSVVLIDNREVMRLNCPNAHNIARPDYFRYGMYKAAWIRQTSNTDRRIVYFSNFKVMY